MLPLAILLLGLAEAAPPSLELHVDPVDVAAVVEVPLEDLTWVNIEHPGGASEAIAEVLGDDFKHCPDLRGPNGFRAAHADDLWRDGLLRYAVVEVTAEGISVGGKQVARLQGGDTAGDDKRGVVIQPLLEALLAQREAQYQFRVACKDPEWVAGGPPTAALAEKLVLAIAPDMPFDIVHEVLLTARKARFRTFYLYAKSRTVVPDPHAEPPKLGDQKSSVYVASDGGLGIDSEEEGRDTASLLLDYLPAPRDSMSARVVPYQASPYAYVVGAAGVLLARGWHPAVLARLDADDLRSTRVAPYPHNTVRSVSGKRAIQVVPVTLPEGDERSAQTRGKRNRFSISGATPHVAIFTPPAHLADALTTPEVGARLKHALTCYRDEEQDTEGLQGELALELRVKPNGQVETVSVLPTSTIEDPHLRRCVVDEFRELRFPSYAVTPEPMLWTVLFLPRAPGAGPGPTAEKPKRGG